MQYKTREEWLNAAAVRLQERFKEGTFFLLPRVSVGFGGNLTKKAIGWCWEKQHAADQRAQIFISPTLIEVASEFGILATLLHEMCHAALPDDVKAHGKEFKALAREVGLEGKATETYASPGLRVWFHALAGELGPYPHAPLSFPEPKQKNRHRKCICETCGYTARVSKKWIGKGTPLCPCNKTPMYYDEGEGDEGDEDATDV